MFSTVFICRENEQGRAGRSPRRRVAPDRERSPDAATEEVALAPAQARLRREENLKEEQRFRAPDDRSKSDVLGHVEKALCGQRSCFTRTTAACCAPATLSKKSRISP
jgi:hypothetical protein